MPRHLRVQIACAHWLQYRHMQPFISFVAAHHCRLCSLTLHNIPPQVEVANAVLAISSRCENLRALRLSAARLLDSRTAVGYDISELWAEQPRLDQLHTLQLTGLRDEQGNVGRLLAICPVLRACTLDLPGISIAMLSTLATSCPLLSHLQLLGITHDSELSLLVLASDERPPSTPFRSLVRLDLHYAADRYAAPTDMPTLSSLHTFLVGSPLRRLTLALEHEAHYQPALAALLAVVAGVESVAVTRGVPELVEAPIAGMAWDDGGEDEESDEKRPINATASSLASVHSLAAATPTPPPSERAASSLVTLELLVQNKLPPIHHLAALLARCPALTSIRLTIHDQYRGTFDISNTDSMRLTLLHCLATIGQHCPLIEQISFRLLHVTPPLAGAGRVVGVDEVRSVVDAYKLPGGAFAHLQRVRELRGGVDVFSDEAAEYVRRHWLSVVSEAALVEAALVDWPPQPNVSSPCYQINDQPSFATSLKKDKVELCAFSTQRCLCCWSKLRVCWPT